MRKISSIIFILLVIMSCKEEKKAPKEKASAFNYPKTKKVDTIDTYFGTQIKDSYRWLEDDKSAETASWVKAQNNVTNAYLNQIPYKDSLKSRLEKLWNYEKVSAPFTRGKNTYFYKNNGMQNHYVLYKKENGKDVVFLDPNTFSKDGTTSLAGLSFTEDGKRLAYSISEGGSDWRKIIVIDTKTKKIIGDTIKNVKFGNITWKGNQGIYYSSYDKPKGSELSAKTDQHKLYYHKIGTPQNNDKVIFGGTPEEKHRYVSAVVTKDQRFLVISAAVSTSGNKLFIKDLKRPNAKLITIQDHTDADTYLVDNIGSKLYLYTNRNAPNGRVVNTTIKAPTEKHWKDVIPQTDNVLSITKGGGYLIANYMVDAVSKAFQYDYTGKKIREIELPGIGTVSGFNGLKNEKHLFYVFGNYNTPNTIYKFNLSNGKSDLYWTPKMDFDSSNYISEQIFYKSKDGTKIPMIITYKKGMKRDGNNPTILYGYGGFNISIKPQFQIKNAVWLEQGGIYAVANIRGGGEYGKKWHKAGTQQNKQNVFDDFIAAAEYLTKENYTSSNYLAISGRSNGGLLVGATLTQRPDLVKVALPGVGVLDMLRYHTFTAGAGWAYDYGTAEQSKEMFNYLKGYSPVHNVTKGKQYPATLVTTADHDDRVVPAHSFKFIAELQEKQTGKNPVLIRIDVNAGHGSGKPVDMIINEWADIYGFTLYNMGYKTLPNK